MHLRYGYASSPLGVTTAITTYGTSVYGGNGAPAVRAPQSDAFGRLTGAGTERWHGLGVRLYDPALERFLQPDPSALDGVRSDVYCHDNPVDCSDPSGLEGVGPNDLFPPIDISGRTDGGEAVPAGKDPCRITNRDRWRSYPTTLP